MSRSMDEISVKDVLVSVGENINPARDLIGTGDVKTDTVESWLPSSSSLAKSRLNEFSPQLSSRRSRQPRSRAHARKVGGSAAAAITRSAFCATCGATPLKPSIHIVHMGHGLNYSNVGAVARIPGVEEFNIGHSIVSRAVLVGMERAVREMKNAIRAA